MTYDEWVKLYNEACDCRDWTTCDILAENYPEYADYYFTIDPEEGDADEGDDDESDIASV